MHASPLSFTANFLERRYLYTFLPEEMLAQSCGRLLSIPGNTDTIARQLWTKQMADCSGGYGSVVEHRHIQALGSSPNTTETKPRGHKVKSTALTAGLPSGTAALWSQHLFQKDSQRVRGHSNVCLDICSHMCQPTSG